TWPVEREHFPRISPRFYSFCGMGPLTRRVATARRVVSALAPALRLHDVAAPKFGDRAVLYPPDAAHHGRWPTFEKDATVLLERAGLHVDRNETLPPPSDVHEAFTGYLCSHFSDFIGGEEMGIGEGLAATALGLLSGGRIDKRIHPVSGALFALVGL